ncbi:lasso peptide biosynthesis B2 protein [Embleya sp. NPDC059237]|uniref:lasso peptide biosynthesis B2 protein n=1 Tax=Embleya sp. NPDC059237 TaxID=3346784 RepID=UPI0036C2C663
MTITMAEAAPAPLSLTRGERAAGHLGLWTATTVLAVLPLRHGLTATRTLRRVAARRHATTDEAVRLRAAVRAAARLHPGRVACLELALATTLAAAVCGRHLDLVLGARFDPLELHAWNTAHDEPVGERNEPDRELHPAYTL